MENKNRNLKKLIVSLSATLFLISLTQDTYYISEMKDSVGSFGLISFLLGWLDIFGPGISWLANPLLIISWFVLIYKNPKISLYLSFIAVVFSLSFLLFKDIIENEGGGKSEIIAYGNGYWLWLSSCFLNFFGNLIIYSKEKNIS